MSQQHAYIVDTPAPSGLRAPRADTSAAPSHELHFPHLSGKRVAMVVFSQYPTDPRPRRAVSALVDEGVKVDLLCERGSDATTRESLGTLQITRIPVGRQRGGILSYAYQYSTFILLSSAILAWRTLWGRYDLVYVHNMPDALVIAGLVPKLFGAKMILDQHDPMPELLTTIFHTSPECKSVKLLRLIEKWSLARTDRIITVNNACMKLFASRGCPAGKIRVVMNSPDERLFTARTPDSYSPTADNAPFVIMYHGSLVERNGLGIAVSALASLRKHIPQLELRIYGKSTSYLEEVLNDAEKLGVREFIHYFGAKAPQEIADEIQLCDVGVIPNQRNAFTEINTPTRIFEYLAMGKPVVAPNTRGIIDYFGPDELFYFTPGDAESIADAIRAVAADRQRAIDRTVSGQKVYLQHTWHEEKITLLKSVSELISKEPIPPLKAS